MSDSDAVKKSKIFVYGQLGEQLKEEDDERVLACIQANPNTTLYNIARKRLKALRDRLREARGDPTQTSQLRDSIEAEVSRCHKFREIAKWMHKEMDDLSMGSTILGEVRQPEAEMEDFMEDEDDYENDYIEQEE